MQRKDPVDALRKKIDQVDTRIVDLLNQRATFAQKIGHVKNLENRSIYVATRERAVLQRLSNLSPGPLPAQAIRAVYREILSACRSIEAPMTVAYLGPEATFTHMAAQQQFGSSVKFLPAPTIAEVFNEVSQGRVDYGVVPIENSTEGVVTHTLDLLVDSESRICAEVRVDIELHLLSRSGRPKDVARILSHPHALAQCRRWLSSHYPNAPVEEVTSTAQAAKTALSNRSVAAVSSPLAKDVYGLALVHAGIADNANNITRFFVIGDKKQEPTGEDKTTVVFSVKDEVGVLHRMLAPFSRSKINLTKIESRPSKRKAWEYLFFLDFNGHVEEPTVAHALKKLGENCNFLKVLGSYPCSL